MAPFRLPSQPPVSFYHTPATINAETQSFLGETRALQDHIVTTVTPETAIFANVIAPLAEHENRTFGQRRVLKWYSSVAVTKDLRNASVASTALIMEFDTQTLLHQDLFNLIDAVLKKGEKLDQESQFYLETRHAEFKRNGLGNRNSARLAEISARLQELKQGYVRNLNATSGSWLTVAELDGFPERMAAGLEEKDGQLFLPHQKPHFETALKTINSGAIRRKVYIENDNRCPDNLPRLQETVLLRDEAARLLGYEHHAAFKMEEKMIKSKDFVESFMSALREKLGPAAREEIASLLQLKKDTLGEQMTDDENRFFVWDLAFYSNISKVAATAFDERKFSEYFELSHSLDGMMATFTQLLGVQFRKIEPEEYKLFGEGHVMVIHESVMVYSVWNDDSIDGEFLGYLYLDLFPRADKYNHAGHYSLQPGYLKADGTRHHPSAALVMNLQPPLPGKPSLLRAEPARSLFHELGHAIHNLTSCTRYAVFHGPSGARDWIEIPSIFLENWFWNPETLVRIGRHYSTLSSELMEIWEAEGGGAVPDNELGAMAEALAKTRYLNAALGVVGSSHTIAFDMKVHSPPSRAEAEAMCQSGGGTLAEIWNRSLVEITGMSAGESLGLGWEWGMGCARMGMYMRGYDAGTWAYVLGKALAQDLYVTKFVPNPMDRAVGLTYREVVLEPGSSRGGMEIMEEFLGREAGAEAWYQEIGIGMQA